MVRLSRTEMNSMLENMSVLKITWQAVPTDVNQARKRNHLRSCTVGMRTCAWLLAGVSSVLINHLRLLKKEAIRDNRSSGNIA